MYVGTILCLSRYGTGLPASYPTCYFSEPLGETGFGLAVAAEELMDLPADTVEPKDEWFNLGPKRSSSICRRERRMHDRERKGHREVRGKWIRGQHGKASGLWEKQGEAGGRVQATGACRRPVPKPGGGWFSLSKASVPVR